MTKIDFNKPLEFEQDSYRVISIFPVRFSNSIYAHAVHYCKPDGSEAVSAVTKHGEVNSMESLVLRNVPPKIIKEVFVNVYKDGGIGLEYSSRSDADLGQLDPGQAGQALRTGILHTAIYDDGQVQQELIQL
jgi:hypothetical protein